VALDDGGDATHERGSHRDRRLVIHGYRIRRRLAELLAHVRVKSER
jgi:hypothetical protein